jgi:queuine tRNA-ribosyltransferase
MLKMKPKFKIVKKTGIARAGEIVTSHGIIKTPAFFPVGTKGTLKSLTGAQIKEIRPQAVLGNTYHLMLQPGEDIVKKMGGLAKMMGLSGPGQAGTSQSLPTMTDSGGFQVFSLGVGLEKPGVKFLREQLPNTNDQLPIEEPRPRLNKITEEGVKFQSHIDGSMHMLSPESSIAIQEKLGADLIVGFDDLESPTYSEDKSRESLELTNRWLLRSLKAQKRKDQLLFGVTHGGQFEDLRRESAKFVNSHFDAVALGGAHSSKKNLYDVINWTVSELDDEKTRHLLGIGEVDDIFEGVERGIDTFDCVIPTRLGRMGHVFVSPSLGNQKNRFRFDITKSKFVSDLRPIDENCSCYVCRTYPRAYINHLFRAHELLAYTLASYHNVHFMVRLTDRIREVIIEKKFENLKKAWFDN